MPENLTNKNQRQTTNFTTHQQKKTIRYVFCSQFVKTSDIWNYKTI